MIEWNDIRMLCARYLVMSERSGPVEAAIRAAGYDDDEEEHEDSEEGMKVERTVSPSFVSCCRLVLTTLSQFICLGILTCEMMVLFLVRMRYEESPPGYSYQ